MKCRNCGAVKKDGIEWYDDTYCSGKCKKEDGGHVPVAHSDPVLQKASLEDYLRDKKHIRYRRRVDPEKLNWGEPLSAPHLKQAGLRANRQPIPGDWDFAKEENNESGK